MKGLIFCCSLWLLRLLRRGNAPSPRNSGAFYHLHCCYRNGIP